MSITRFGIELFKRYPRLFFGNAALSLILMLVDAASILSVAPVISILAKGQSDDAITPYMTMVVDALGVNKSIETFLLIFVILSVISSLVRVGINYFILRAQYIVRTDMVIGTAEFILYSGINYINRQRQGDFINTLTQEIVRVAEAFTALSRLIAPVAQVAILMFIPFYISWKLTAISLAAALLLTFPLRLFRKMSYRLGVTHTKSSNYFNAMLQEMLANIRLIAGYANEKLSLLSLDRALGLMRDAALKSQILQTSIYTAHEPIGIILVFVTFLVGKNLEVPLAEVAVIIYAFNRLAGTLANINQYKYQLLNLYPSYEQLMNIRKDADGARLVFGNKKVTSIRDGIRLENIFHTYDTNAPVLKNINLFIPAGKMTALVGASGSGKSTLADLVLGMQVPTSGRIFIDDHPMEDIDISIYRQSIGYVPQQSSLMHASIRENIVWANPQASDSDIRESCRLANADEFISKLEEGIDTVVGDRGVRLSGGQVQRIALARAMVRKPSLFILDEATSALDSSSENMIQSAIENIVGKSTILAIAHRLSTIAKADNIVVLDHGEIIEQGTFDNLISQKGAFYRLVELQQI